MYRLNLDRLAKVLGMMESEHDGEALQAARTAVQMVRAAELTWPQIVRPEPVRPHYTIHGNGWNVPLEEDHREAAQIIIDWIENNDLWLGEQEPDFLDTVRNWHRPLSEAQQNWFNKIVLRARRRGCPV